MYPPHLSSILRSFSESLLGETSSSVDNPDCGLPPLPTLASNDTQPSLNHPHQHVNCGHSHHHHHDMEAEDEEVHYSFSDPAESDIHDSDWLSIDEAIEGEYQDTEESLTSTISSVPSVSQEQTELRKKIVAIQTDSSISASEKSKKIQVCFYPTTSKYGNSNNLSSRS